MWHFFLTCFAGDTSPSATAEAGRDLSPTATPTDTATSPSNVEDARDAEIAVLRGKCSRLVCAHLINFLSFFLAQLAALQHQLAAQGTAAGTSTAEHAPVARPTNIGNLQMAMRLEDSRKYRSFCVSPSFFLTMCLET
jgi:hypothetical protein